MIISMRWLLPIALFVQATGAGAGDAEILRLAPSHQVVALFNEGERAMVRLASPQGPVFRALSLRAGALSLHAVPDYQAKPPPILADMLPDGIVTMGDRDIAAAWLTGPTHRYDHGVLGDAVEAFAEAAAPA